ncbi:uncharacterized protein BDCG_04900 [Blastomyces dermatitidis ER-3]|uniref:Uncharacterized protein n=2 Tax=Blastomyces TaxID=229219 RepID=A0A179US27_BLAGS|nr:uncharacterized protein BDBG_06396 [Blastomyces gilchristii SLH14081]XP_045276631.1 uncharacterized protein BDCG_04900 [Blastomyces dermatitidis ER-3]EEQ89780.1 hypothetical protein BDCG_04900 [Blastomyces dermatitidis ER-3]EQL37979.1 hypothetical protein BDFG_00998 [Blastomyces dermatitidis ATCC 26199]OAT10573.1 hypothetical protein BDBG_06396 [Blastomyces gilchristii SLH14081]
MAHCERGVCEGFAVHSRKLSKLLEPGCAQHNSYWMTGVITNNSEAGSHCLAERRVVLSISLVTRIASRKRELSSQEGQHEGRLPRLNCKRELQAVTFAATLWLAVALRVKPQGLTEL